MDLTSSQGGFRSRRSYPTLNQVSLAPLTPRFPIDDDDDDEDDDDDKDTELQDYFTPRNNDLSDDHHHHPSTTPQPRTSYLSSYSVPGTPGVLSHSRSTSRTRHARSKSTHASDSSLQNQDVDHPLHHHHHDHNCGNGKKKRSSAPSRNHLPEAPGNHHHHSRRSEAEWMLRAGIALASSTREEKGQSWLVKRQSSTSLVSETNYDGSTTLPNGRTGSGGPRRSRSGMSTPATAFHSRRGSRSLAASRRSSKHELAMTNIDVATGVSRRASSTLPSPGGDIRTLVPDFVDERIRAEMAFIQHGDHDYDHDDPFSDEYSSDSADEIDELEMQRLTRERGFGLGSWVDRLVEWTLFSVDELPTSSTSGGGSGYGSGGGNRVQFQTQPGGHVGDHQVSDGGQNRTIPKDDESDDDHDNTAASREGLIGDNDNDTVSVGDNDHTQVLEAGETPGDNGGWEDAGWLFRAVKRAILV